jgi:diadenosine tetraphosphatase ApaH/serine/threonine PP2A family protein phosphatase
MSAASSTSTSTLSQQQQVLLESKEREVNILRERCASLSLQLQNALQQQHHPRYPPAADVEEGTKRLINPSHGPATTTSTGSNRPFHPLSPHAVNVREVPVYGNGYSHSGSSSSALLSSSSSAVHRNHPTNNNNNSPSTSSTMIATQRERIGRNASLATRTVLNSIVHAEQEQTKTNTKQHKLQLIVQRIMQMFQSPTQSMEYIQSTQFAYDIVVLCFAVSKLLEQEPRCVFIQSPCYVFGDIHGNIEDLHFFSDNIWRLGMSLTAGNFLFLGDYVDRGMNCLETVAYLLAMKYTIPTKIFLLRGNHETRDVNGWEEHYHQRSFIYQCRYRFGNDLGYRVWEACNSVFDRLPLAAIIDQDIFCVHGGIPRPIIVSNANTTSVTTTTRIQDILSVPKVAGINPPYEHEDDQYQQVASDCIWSDPASEQQELYTVDAQTGFGESLRGGGAICFGHLAVTNFLQQHHLSYIMRAHEAHAEGVAISKGARVFTVFSTSQDHNQGSNAMAGCILVDNAKLQVINRSPACTFGFEL